MIDLLLLGALGAIVATAAWTDLRQRRIPNWLCLTNLALGLASAGYAAGMPGLGWAAAHVALALFAGMGLVALGMVGAGDAKFYASMAAWLPLFHALWLLVSVALAGLLLLIGFLAWRLSRKVKAPVDTPSDFDKLPYGLAIGFGGLVAVAFGP